jgi:hypothetical protein
VNDARLERMTGPERRLSPAEARAYLDAPLTDAEREDVRALVAWFCRRYQAPIDRLAYARRAYARWQRTRGIAGPSGGAVPAPTIRQDG